MIIQDIIVVPEDDKDAFKVANKDYKELFDNFSVVVLYFNLYQRYRIEDIALCSEIITRELKEGEDSHNTADILLWCYCEDIVHEFKFKKQAPSTAQSKDKDKELASDPALLNDYKEYVWACLYSGFSEKEAQREIERQQQALETKNLNETKKGKKLLKKKAKVPSEPTPSIPLSEGVDSLPNNRFANYNRDWYNYGDVGNRRWLDEYVVQVKKEYPHRKFFYMVFPESPLVYPTLFYSPGFLRDSQGKEKEI